MLNQANRLAKTRDFNLLMQYGRSAKGTFFDFRYLPLAKAGEFFPLPKKTDKDNFKLQLKLAITIGLKVSKSAVVRNRIKRQAREVVRLLLKENKIRFGYYGMFVAKKEAVGKEYTEISEEIKVLFEKAHILM